MKNFLTGNIHCHSSNSDGDCSPAMVAQHYRDCGYDFCAITDHNHLTAPEEAMVEGDDFVVLPGSEYSARALKADGRTVPMHSNGIGLTAAFRVELEGDIDVCMRDVIGQCREQDAFCMVNHPNWHWALSAEDIAANPGFAAMEVFNGNAVCNNEGGPGHPSSDVIWDELLTRGYRLWGVASDDGHHFTKHFTPHRFTPCTGYIAVAAERSAASIVAALKAGEFYATSGILLNDITIDDSSYALDIGQVRQDPTVFWTIFIGAGGKELAVIDGPNPSYTIRGDEGYVRARVHDSGGLRAWTQPLFLDT